MTARRITIAIASLLATFAVAALSRVPFAEADAASALVRLSWRTQGVSIEECRALTEEELARIPSHMRRTEECVGYIADYELSVALDGSPALVDTVRAAGARRDRPVYVFRDLAVEPGTHRVTVTFNAVVPPDFDASGRTLTLDWEGSVELRAGEIALITLDETGTTLVRQDSEG